ncbi:MAG: carbamoyl phosphate synthase small subunit [Firmicutes bacterium]|nr:carbamoyl phosphate synthase small subunit [Bacillota bacterium]
MTAYLILENGTVFEGEFFGKPGEVAGEIVFTTGMVGYLETVTDPSYFGQIILQTFPLIGNYGVISSDLQNSTVSAKAYIVKYLCQEPSNFRSEEALDTFFMSKGITGLKGIDTRALTQIIRENGTVKGKITINPPTETDREEACSHEVTGAIAAVSCKELKVYGEGKYRIALLDFGVKQSIINALTARDCAVWVFPHHTTVKDILDINPHGILLSSGPGDPEDPANKPIIETLRKLKNCGIPMFGIDMGHLLLAMANGYKTKTMKLGHRGANQPVKDLGTGRVYITAQNHGYTVLAENASFVNVNDGTCEGLDYGNSFSVQFCPGEGPKDTEFLFDKFVEMAVNCNASR